MKDVDGVKVAWRQAVKMNSKLHAEFILTCGPVQSLGWAWMKLGDDDSSVTVELPSGTTVSAEVERMLVSGFRDQQFAYLRMKMAARGAVAA